MLNKDYGTLKRTFKIKRFKVSMYTSKKRDWINPFSAQFPYLINQDGNSCHISVSPQTEISNLEKELIKYNSVNENEELKLDFLKVLFDCKMLEVNRYLIKSNVINTNNTDLFNPITENEIEKLSKICNIPKPILQKLNREHKIYLNLRANEIVGYGFITREFDNIVEISVATIKAERGKGFGLETVRLMTDLILRNGKSILYIAEVANIASNKIALKCCYEFIAIELLGYKGESR